MFSVGIIHGIYGNFLALQNAIKIFNNFMVKIYVMLGDIIGLGPNPIECIELVDKLFNLIIPGDSETIIHKFKTFGINEEICNV